jgi:predicted TIM-barrel fold metal-dependent hydrolase
MLIDINTWYGHWPFQRFTIRTVRDLERHLVDHGIEKALVSHLGTVFYQDPDPYNQELLQSCRRSKVLTAVPVINPHLNRWQDVFDDYVNQGVKTVRIIPTFHNYRLYTRQVFELVEALAERDMRLIIQMRFEDERDRYFALNIHGPKIKQMVRLARRFPDFDFVCTNVYLPEAKEIGKETDNVHVDISFAEWLFTIEEMLSELGPDRIFFGSHTPILYTKPTVMKLMDSGVPKAVKEQIAGRNAAAFFGL